VLEDRDPEPSGEEGLADIRVLEAIQRAIDSGRTEQVQAVRRRLRPSKAQAVRRKPHKMPELVHAQPPGRE
jgi:glucose-fructose oxidoreductase